MKVKKIIENSLNNIFIFLKKIMRVGLTKPEDCYKREVMIA